MKHSRQTSVIIPVYNKWALTKECLSSLAKTLPSNACNIVVVDNASTDETGTECPLLGKALFEENFLYHRVNQNINFGPASNLGARLSKSEYLLFLNNDTIATPNWYAPLIQDFSDFPNIAATGPILMYPASGILEPTIQHLGVFVSPTLRVGHLYEGIFASSPLAKKRRFFQIITAASLLTPRKLFFEYGGFDEAYINGFEDVDFCAKLWGAGYRMTINPSSHLYHLTSQTPGRHDYEKENSQHFTQKAAKYLMPDLHLHAQADNFELKVSPWLTMVPSLPEVTTTKLRPLEKEEQHTVLINFLKNYPLWYEGYAQLAICLEKQDLAKEAHTIKLSLARMNPVPDTLLNVIASCITQKDIPALEFIYSTLIAFCTSFEYYLKNNNETFYTNTFQPFIQKMCKFTASSTPSPLNNWAYTLWREQTDLPSRKNAEIYAPVIVAHPEIRFSILMPVYNPNPEHLSAAINSIIHQHWPHWELCIADDCSSAPQTRTLLEYLSTLDSRIRITYRKTNGKIALATNTALEMAKAPYVALMDQDDLLTPDALAECATTLLLHPDAMLIYSDEDKVLDDGTFFYPHFKSNWDAELLLSNNYVSHLGVYKTEHLRKIGGFQPGYEGAQDYDMLLRYRRNLDKKNFIHIPKILYHWRSHENSTASSIDTKSYALESTRKTLQEDLNSRQINAHITPIANTSYMRVNYTLPQPAPLVSLIMDIDSTFSLAPALIESLYVKPGYNKFEILLIHNKPEKSTDLAQLDRWASNFPQVHLLPRPNGQTKTETANYAANIAKGKILGFIGKGVTPVTQDWLAIIVSHLTQSGAGALGCSLLNKHGVLWNQGYSCDAEGILFSLFREHARNEPGYYSWNMLARTVASADPRNLFTYKKHFISLNGFDSTMGNAASIDFCLRLAEKDLPTICIPYVEFILATGTSAAWEDNTHVCSPELTQRWENKIIPSNPNLIAGQTGWGLRLLKTPTHPPYAPFSSRNILPLVIPRPDSAKNSLNIKSLHQEKETSTPSILTREKIKQEIIQTGLFDSEFYLQTNADVKAAKIDPFEHYIHQGFIEGRPPHRGFDIEFYAGQSPELQNGQIEPLQHYIEKGRDQGLFLQKPSVLIRKNNGVYEELADAALPSKDLAVLAWYLPQFHPIGENDIAWGKGFTEWTNVMRAQPCFEEHYQPRSPGALGYYDLRLKETLYNQAALAKHAGISGFCFHHYWFNGRTALTAPIEHLKNDPDIPLSFCLHWANEPWSRRWDGGAHEIIIPQEHSPEIDKRFLEDISWALRDKRYIRFQDKPVIGIYRSSLFPQMKETLEQWRIYCRNTDIGEIFVFLTGSFQQGEAQVKEYGFDGLVEFYPHGLNLPARNPLYIDKKLKYHGQIFDYAQALDYALANSATPYTFPCFRGLMPSWDNSARTKCGQIYAASSPEKYKDWLSSTIRLAQQDTYDGTPLIFINAWNEWAEGAYLEPDERYGFANLNATVNAITTLSKELSQTLLIVNMEDATALEQLRLILTENSKHPIMRPFVLSLVPVHNIGTFEGLAPLFCMAEDVQVYPLAHQLAAAGYKKFTLGLIIPGEMPKKERFGHLWKEAWHAINNNICSNCIIFTDTAIEVVLDNASFSFESYNKKIPLFHIASLNTQSLGMTKANVLNPVTTKQQTTRLLSLLHEFAQKPIQLSIIPLLPEKDEISLSGLLQIQQQCNLIMEILIPRDWLPFCKDTLNNLQSIQYSSPAEYYTNAIQAAQSEYIWFFSPDLHVEQKVLKAMHRSFIHEKIACTRCYGEEGPDGNDCIPHLLGNDTYAFSGNDIIRSAQSKKLPLLPSISHIIFRKTIIHNISLLEFQQQADMLCALAKLAHLNTTVAIVSSTLAKK